MSRPPVPPPTEMDVGARLATLADMLNQAVAVLNETLLEIKAKEVADDRSGADGTGVERGK